MKCKFCYATFQDVSVIQQMTSENVVKILTKLKKAGVEKVTFAGGEPFLYKDLMYVIIKAKELGLTTSIITNGSLLTPAWMFAMIGHLDWIGISIDSLCTDTNIKIGRTSNKEVNYHTLLHYIKDYGYKLKVNTVVNRFNEKERMSSFIEFFEVDRWKVFDTLKVKGQNDKQFDAIKPKDFNGFILNNTTKNMVVETNELMTGSYLLINPVGQIYENWGTGEVKSDSLINFSVKHCLKQVTLDKDRFIARGGEYKW